MQIHWPQKEGCRKVFIGGSDAARFANCPIAKPSPDLATLPASATLPEVANVSQLGRGFDFCHQNVHCTYLPSNSIPHALLFQMGMHFRR